MAEYRSWSDEYPWTKRALAKEPDKASPRQKLERILLHKYGRAKASQQDRETWLNTSDDPE
jgi:hypothetical protein